MNERMNDSIDGVNGCFVTIRWNPKAAFATPYIYKTTALQYNSEN